QPVVLAEMTLRNLLSGKEVDHADFLARTDILGTLSVDVLISRFQPYYQVADYLSRYTDRLIGLAVGLPRKANGRRKILYRSPGRRSRIDGSPLQAVRQNVCVSDARSAVRRNPQRRDYGDRSSLASHAGSTDGDWACRADTRFQ